MPPTQNLEDVLSGVQPQGTEGELTFGDILTGFGARAFGPMLVVPAFIAVAPTGAIPGMSLLTGSIIAVIAIQMIAQREQPWLPLRLKQVSFSQERLHGAIERAQPYARWFDKFVGERLTILSGNTATTAIGLVSLVMALMMFPLALLPFAVAVPGTAVFLLGLGLMARDGLFVLAGFLVAAATLLLPLALAT